MIQLQSLPSIIFVFKIPDWHTDGSSCFSKNTRVKCPAQHSVEAHWSYLFRKKMVAEITVTVVIMFNNTSLSTNTSSSYLLHGDLWLGRHVLLRVAHTGSIFVLRHGSYRSSGGRRAGRALAECLSRWGQSGGKTLKHIWTHNRVKPEQSAAHVCVWILTHALWRHHARDLGVGGGGSADGVKGLRPGCWWAHGVWHVLEVWTRKQAETLNIHLFYNKLKSRGPRIYQHWSSYF